MPRLPAKQREAEKVEMQLADGRYACAVAESPARHSWDVSLHKMRRFAKLNYDNIPSNSCNIFFL
jgi:hypothetical protein